MECEGLAEGSRIYRDPAQENGLFFQVIIFKKIHEMFEQSVLPLHYVSFLQSISAFSPAQN